MRLVSKSWLWKLTGPFASSNYTTIGDTLYCPFNPPYASAETIRHEEVHSRQQRRFSLPGFAVLYLFCLPLFWNPFRWRWEREAYRQNATDAEAIKLLRSAMYGWLRNKD